MTNELTPERIRHIELSWKSDVDLKLDRLVRFADEYEAFVRSLAEREKRSAAFRTAVIEKTSIGLLVAGLVFVASAAWEAVKAWLRAMK